MIPKKTIQIHRKTLTLSRLLPRFSPGYLFGGSFLVGLALASSYRKDLSSDLVEQAYTNDNSNFVDINEQSVHYRRTGSGKPLLLLHGTASSLHTWSGWSNRLEDSLDLIRLDLPGFGLTGSDPDENYKLKHYVSFLNDFVDRIGLDKFSVAGNSFGGLLALRYLTKHPNRVDKLILINSMGFEKRWPLPFLLGKIPFFDPMKKFTPKSIVGVVLKHIYGNPSKLKDSTVQRYFQLLLREDNREALHNFIQQTHQQNRKTFENELKTINNKTLLQWGRKDPWFPVAHAEKFRECLSDSSLVTYLNAGHLPMEEIPDQTASDALAFLNS